MTGDMQAIMLLSFEKYTDLTKKKGLGTGPLEPSWLKEKKEKCLIHKGMFLTPPPACPSKKKLLDNRNLD